MTDTNTVALITAAIVSFAGTVVTQMYQARKDKAELAQRAAEEAAEYRLKEEELRQKAAQRHDDMTALVDRRSREISAHVRMSLGETAYAIEEQTSAINPKLDAIARSTSSLSTLLKVNATSMRNAANNLELIYQLRGKNQLDETAWRDAEAKAVEAEEEFKHYLDSSACPPPTPISS